MSKIKFRNKELQERFFRHYANWSPCKACAIGATAKHKVFYRGKLPCDVLFIGEAPGKTEDSLGLPFVGRAGMILDALIVRARDASPSPWTWGITNIVSCRPCDGPGQPNRPPSSREVRNCRTRLEEILVMAQPKMFVLLGASAQKTLEPLLLPNRYVNLYHPAYLARGGGEKHPAFDVEVERLLLAIKVHMQGE